MIRYSAIILLSYLLLACSSATNTSIKSLKGKIPDNVGIVIAEVYSNDRYLPGSQTGWNELVFIDIDAEKQQLYTVQQINEASSRSTFAGALPVGRYGLALLAYRNRSDTGAVSVKVSLPQSLGIFEVRPQNVTNLGTILYHTTKAQHYLDSTLASYAVSREENQALYGKIKHQFPDLFANINPELTPETWNRDNFNTFRDTAKDMILAADLPVDFVKSNMHYYVMTKSGNIISARNSDWEMIDTGLTSQVKQLAEIDDTNLLVADEFQQLYKIKLPAPKEKTQKKSRLRTRDDTQEKIQGTPEHLKVETVKAVKRVANLPIVVTHIPNQKIKIYAYQENAISLMSEFDYGAFLAKVEEDKPTVYFGDETVSINVEGNLIQFNVAESTWVQSLSPNYHKVYRLDNNYLVAAEASQWTRYKNISLSTDNGVNWTNTPIDGGYDVYFDKSRALYYVEQGYKTSFDAPPEILNKVPFYHSKDKGLTVDAISKLPRMCDNFLASESDINNFFVLCTGGDIYRSADQGKSWKVFYKRNKVDVKKFPKILFTEMN